MVLATRVSLLLALAAACGFPRPADVGDGGPGDANPSSDGDPAGDAAEQPGSTLRVSPMGDDANDGVAAPVKTLKRAIGLAAENSQITDVVLASGRYSSANGERFPYTVPTNVTITGPAGGAAILAGTKTEPGILIDTGGLQNLDLEDFTTAIAAAGSASLKNIRVLTSALAVHAETSAKLTVDNLDITGTAGACAIGIVLNGSAQLNATTLATRKLQTTLDARDQSAISIANANISGDSSCSQGTAIIMVISNQSFVLNDSLLDGGPSVGIQLGGRSTSLHAMISNTIVRNVRSDALLAGGISGGSISLQMTGSELSNNGTGAQLFRGTFTITDVTIRQNTGLALYLQDAVMTMRESTITGNGGGIDLFDNARADLGTAASRGNNILQANTGVGLALDGVFGATLINAVGNTWNPNVQGADATGTYATPSAVLGPITFVNGNNFQIINNWSLLR